MTSVNSSDISQVPAPPVAKDQVCLLYFNKANIFFDLVT